MADGVGSLAGSSNASKAAVGAVEQWSLRQNGSMLSQVESMYEEIDQAVRNALEGSEAGATTLACLLAEKDGYLLTAIGDSEIVAVYESGETALLNELDHVPSRPNVLLAWIDGKTELAPHVAQMSRLPDFLCLITDGVSKVVDYERIGKEVLQAGVEAAATRLVEVAREAGAQDDLTAIVVSANLFEPRGS